MLDLNEILRYPDKIEENLRQRDPTITLAGIIELANTLYGKKKEFDTLRSQINQRSKPEYTKGLNDEDMLDYRKFTKALSDQAKGVNTEITQLEESLNYELLRVPNLLGPNTPISQRKEDSIIVRTYKDAPTFDFEIKDHLTLCTTLDILDFKRGAKIAQAGFPVYKGKGAMLEWALLHYMVDHSTRNGFEFLLLPFLNNTTSLTASGNLPKFAEEIYSCKDDDLHAIPTSEVSITNMYRDELLSETELPKRIISYSPCFRREAGSYGKKAKGLMRLHQFNKVESYSICTPENSAQEHQILIHNAEKILEALGLHYRTANLPSCDIANQSSETHDIEVWLPHAEMYSEVSSASNCLDYQARRANIKYKSPEGNRYVHTLNCSALATPRLFISIVETNQTPDGHILIPEVLQRYTGFDKI
jgi:seryl-tRNA synthetase